MKAKVKYQEVDYIQYNGNNEDAIRKFIGKPICEVKGVITFIVFINDDRRIAINISNYVVKVNDKDIIILEENDFSKLFEPINS